MQQPKRASRIVFITESNWDLVQLMSAHLGADSDSLLNQAIYALARQNGFVEPPRATQAAGQAAAVQPSEADTKVAPLPPASVLAPLPQPSAPVAAAPARAPVPPIAAAAPVAPAPAPKPPPPVASTPPVAVAQPPPPPAVKPAEPAPIPPPAPPPPVRVTAPEPKPPAPSAVRPASQQATPVAPVTPSAPVVQVAVPTATDIARMRVLLAEVERIAEPQPDRPLTEEEAEAAQAPREEREETEAAGVPPTVGLEAAPEPAERVASAADEPAEPAASAAPAPGDEFPPFQVDDKEEPTRSREVPVAAAPEAALLEAAAPERASPTQIEENDDVHLRPTHDVAAAGARWFIQHGDAAPVELSGDRFVIGRSLNCQLVINSAHVSREHAVIQSKPDGLVLEDLNSANGLWLGQKRIATHVIADGDEISLGGERIKFSLRP